MQVTSPVRDPLITGGKTYKDVTNDIARHVEGKPTKGWLLGLAVSLTVLLLGSLALVATLWEGIGMWGLNKTVGWAWDITNFVWWVGIGHAGTLISAVLLLFRQKWRTSINRAAEAMTIFAVICAAVFPLIHMGRPWIGAIWALPLPNTYGSLWVYFNSPLLWDVFAISTYFSVSLVLSVHTIVSFDFATSVIPGWHTTIFPPYFVAGAIFSGFAMVLTLMIVTRKVFKLEDYITMGHIELMNIVIIITGSIVGIAYITEFFIAWYSGVAAEQYAFVNRMFGPYWWAYWSMMTCNVISPQLFWFKKIRTSIVATFILSLIVNIGMWFERFVIIVILR